jgi:F-type H+-transporting ATPase subunit epsilon
MANTMQFDLDSPERRLASGEATEVQIPGAVGDMTAMADHAATITTLRPGLLRVIGTDGTKEYLVTGGFAEISAASTSVLAEMALPRDEVTQDILAELVEAARNATGEGDADVVAKRVADIQAVASQLGMSV